MNGTAHRDLAPDAPPLTSVLIWQEVAMSQDTSIPVGLCQCGCGRATKVAVKTRRGRGYQKGQPMPYALGHHSRTRPPFRWETRGDVVVLFLTHPNGSPVEALIDATDFEAIRDKHVWVVERRRTCYVQVQLSDRKDYLHRMLLNAPPKVPVDHDNHNGLDNRRANIQVSTPRRNSLNAQLRRDNRSGFRGVTWDSTREKWRVEIAGSGIGRFDDVVEAAHAYDAAARARYGAFAQVNFPRVGERGVDGFVRMEGGA
jgi:hypothetical protein